MPYLRIFEEERGTSRDVPLEGDRIILGRNPEMADVVIGDGTVSRQHAILHSRNGKCLIEDKRSTSGTFVNGESVPHAVLSHNDSIQLGNTVMEYRTDDQQHAREEQQADANPLIANLRRGFRLLPTGMRLRYRVLSVISRELYSPGDTLQIGGGGILLPAKKCQPEYSSLELELISPNNKRKCIMGEVMAILTDQTPHSMCIKLHKLSDEEYEMVMRKHRRGPWIEAWPIPKDSPGPENLRRTIM